MSFRTLNRWLALGKISRPLASRSAVAARSGAGPTRDIAKGRKVKAAQKPGPKARRK